MSRPTQGIITGCDAEQECLLPWWWDCLSEHSNYPVCFFDFGMSSEARKWCEARGEVRSIDLPVQLAPKEQINPLLIEQWESTAGSNLWKERLAWFKKPFAIHTAPFEQGLWLDLDCEVRGPLDLIFNHLWLGATLLMTPGVVCDPQLQRQLGSLHEGAIFYNTGVVGFRSGDPILQAWIEEIRLHNDLYVSDDHALSHVIWKTNHSVIHLPRSFNSTPQKGTFQKTVIVHYMGGLRNKLLLMQRVLNKGFVFRGATANGDAASLGRADRLSR